MLTIIISFDFYASKVEYFLMESILDKCIIPMYFIYQRNHEHKSYRFFARESIWGRRAKDDGNRDPPDQRANLLPSQDQLPTAKGPESGCNISPGPYPCWNEEYRNEMLFKLSGCMGQSVPLTPLSPPEIFMGLRFSLFKLLSYISPSPARGNLFYLNSPTFTFGGRTKRSPNM